jgi:uncharacterized membrane protein
LGVEELMSANIGTPNKLVVLFVLALIAVVVCVDVVFFRHRFAERLVANVGIVVVFIALYLTFLRRR